MRICCSMSMTKPLLNFDSRAPGAKKAMSGQSTVLPPMREAASIVDEWMSLPNVTSLSRRPTPADFRRPDESGAVHSLFVRGAHLAALAIERGAASCTNHRGFARFPELQIRR